MFCKYCGKPLEEGQTCSCQKAGEKENQFAEQAGKAMNQLVSGTKGLIKRFLPLFKSPVSEQRDMIQGQDKTIGMQMLGLHAVANLLVMIIACIAIRVELGDYAKYVKVPYVRMVLVAVLITIVADFVIAGALYVVTKLLFNVESNFRQMMILTGSKAVVESVTMFVGYVLALIYAPAGMIIIVLGMVLGLLFLLGGYYNTVEMNEDKRVYALFAVAVAVLIINGIMTGAFAASVGERLLSVFF